MADLIEEIRVPASKWLKTQGPAPEAFRWKKGYGAFSVDPGSLDGLMRYI